MSTVDPWQIAGKLQVHIPYILIEKPINKYPKYKKESQNDSFSLWRNRIIRNISMLFYFTFMVLYIAEAASPFVMIFVPLNLPFSSPRIMPKP